MSAQADPPVLGWPKAVVVVLVGLVVLLAAGTLLLRQLTGPAQPQAQVPPASVTPAGLTLPVATTAPAPTLPPAALAPTAIPSPTLPAAVVPTAIPSTAGTPASTAGAQSFSATSSPVIETSPLPTVAPELRQEVESAYTQYWDARAEAVWTLDPAPLDAVATGDELLALRQNVDQLRAEGHAIRAEVQHQYTAVRVDGDQAQIADRLRDFSIYVDAQTHDPLPGQARPTDADAPQSTILYFLRKVHGSWKIERGERHVDS